MKPGLSALLFSTALFAAAPAMAQMAPAAGPMAAKADMPELHYLNADDFLPQRILALPPARGSAAEALELAQVKAMVASASPERRAQAAWDSDHEDPAIFNAVLGRDLTKLPATWELLQLVVSEAEVVIDRAKVAFGRVRPYGIDPTIQTCVKTDPGKAAKSYPSGHSAVGYASGWVLARLMPDFAPPILARAQEYAENRVACGVHFPSDTEASHVVATLVADRLLNDPRLADKVARAKAELAAP